MAKERKGLRGMLTDIFARDTSPEALMEPRKGLAGLFDNSGRRMARALEEQSFEDYRDMTEGDDRKESPQETARKAAQASEAQAAQAASASAQLGQQALASSGQQAGQFAEVQQGLQEQLADTFYQNYAAASQNASAEALAEREAIRNRAAANAQQQMERRERQFQKAVKGITSMLNLLGLTNPRTGQLAAPSGSAPEGDPDQEALNEAFEGPAAAGSVGGGI